MTTNIILDNFYRGKKGEKTNNKSSSIQFFTRLLPICRDADIRHAVAANDMQIN